MTQELQALPASLPAAPADRSLRCTAIRPETAEVTTFTFEPETGEVFGWLPGQYLTLLLDTPHGQLARCYTISSIPRDGLEITVKALPGGPASRWLHDSLAPGAVIEAHGPLGGFTPPALAGALPGPQPGYLFLAAGSGITPLMSITRALLDSGDPVDAVLLYSAHDPGDVIFHRELRSIPEASGIRVETILSTGSIPTVGIPRAPGRLDADLLLELVPDVRGREVFACGPPQYLEAVRGMLETAGCEASALTVESFDIADHAPANTTAQPPEAARESQVFSVEFVRSGRTIECPADTFVLDAALAAGIPVPSSCTLGMCGTCKSGLLQGTVEMNHAGGIRPREIAAGKILICCSTPTGDLVIDA
ncbi:hybrid-cluster NAD(P)-dependent oxidoreductase [Paeniglutamicibacter psychrophenolicus]|uniref:Ferredoxin-NADP reductase n=1 Tax=Paeniglutamicibacter psychrophenolicus TaxID=257454 RepID=A0ABS4WEE6_9MICC|nr:iron-sulfur cluster-binding domain-containing protein [Paeniglutamicibacter psychrophenolicus]MBP2374562.1 ferredoxin-NADP reductase [Paeniglutamicibacter psychrophenolicus]